MREILFRGKRIDNGKWVQGYLYRLSEKLNPFILLKSEKGASYEVDAKTVGQYTGMVDKNGTKIFEGDICNFSSRSDIDNYGVVVYDADETEFGIDYGSTYLGLGKHYHSRNVEVIGNIYDNPNLIRGEIK